jgi:hypothetical protein
MGKEQRFGDTSGSRRMQDHSGFVGVAIGAKEEEPRLRIVA